MLVRTYIPRPPLSDFVDSLWLYEGPAPPYSRERILPTGTMEIVINLHEDRLRLFDRQNTDRAENYRGCLIAGAQSTFIVIDSTLNSAALGVQFKPGGAFPFIKPPADALQDQVVPLEALWGTAATNLREQLLVAQTPESRFQLVEQALLAQLTRPLARHPAVAFALTQLADVPPTRTVAEVAARTGLSARRFIQVFKAQVGLTPKLYCRIRRFQATLHSVQPQRTVAWTNLASACGYFDQAHFIHDFRAFSGLTPSDYLKHQSDHSGHVPVNE